MIRAAKWGVPALAVLVSLGFMLPALADGAKDKRPNDVSHAKKMVSLIEQGQLDLVAATKIAEKHVKGTALRAHCEIRPDESQARDRLVYDVTCLADGKNQMQEVHVDGLTKKVTERRDVP